MKELIEPQILVTLESPRQVGKRKAYEHYKDSGIEWLGRIPEHWEARRLKYLTRLKYGDALPSERREEGTIVVFGSNGPVGTHSRANTTSPVIILGRKGSSGKIVFSEEACFAIDTTYYIDRMQKEVNIRWLFYILGLLGLDKVSEDSAIPGLSREYVHAQQLPLPSLHEQRAIIAFLDRETANISELIAKKERLIELLQERRTAIINQAVTKGLNPDVPMKDSGVEWLGEIPVHWEIVRLKYLAEEGLSNGLFKKKDMYGSGTKLVNVVDIYQNTYIVDINRLNRVQANFSEIKTYQVNEGDIFFVRSSLKLEGVGASACVKTVMEPILFECHLVRMRPSASRVDPLFLINYLNACISRQRLISLAYTTTMTTIGQDKMSSLEVILPPMIEQKAILAYIDQETTKIDKLISRIQEGIKKLKEYSTALISAAVTGKIDVRGEVADMSAEDAAI